MIDNLDAEMILLTTALSKFAPGEMTDKILALEEPFLPIKLKIDRVKYEKNRHYIDIMFVF